MKRPPEPPVELERYELDERGFYRFKPDRRAFLQISGAGLLVVLTRREGLALQESEPRDLAAWLHIGEDGRITVYTGKVEVGQNIRTSLAQVVSEELRTPMESIALVMGDTARTPYDRGTFGSRTTPFMAPRIRHAAVTARELLIDLAAERWKVPRDSIAVDDGRIRHRESGRSLHFGELTEGRRLTREVSAELETTPPERWRVVGRSVPKVDGRSFVTGAHRFTCDLRLPGMLFGKIVRPPAFGAVPASVDADAARKISGVTVVHDGDFLGVAADSEARAEQSARAVRVEWTSPARPQPSNREIFDYLKSNASAGGRPIHASGSVEDALASADRTLEAAYTVAYIAHAPLEPRAALAQWTGDELTVWTGTQRPFGVRSELAAAFRLPEEKMRVVMPDTGSGYGGKHTGEAAVEAARLARAAGRPVRVVWTREEEFTWAYFRPAGVIEVKSGVRRDGTLTAWEFHNYNSGGAAIRTLYQVANQRIEFHPVSSPLRQGSYRALAATANHFARESHMDELAGLLGVDPLEFRLRNLADPRLRAVLETAAETFGWASGKRRNGVGHGLACGFEKGGYLANCVEVEVSGDQGEVRVRRVVAAFECGAVVNPEHLKSQVEGCIVQGIGGALFEAVEFAEGRIRNARFSRYRVPRFSDTPDIEVVLVDRRDLPSAGGSETPIVALAPAVAGALFEVTGVRLRSLPLAPQGMETTS